MRTEPCKKCNNFDFYQRGNFSYCRPCHSEAQKRYASKVKADVERLKPPVESLEQLMAKPKSPQGEKTHCINGHPFSGSNLRMSSQRHGRHVRRRCRACERNAKRVTYGLAPEPAPLTLGKLLEG